MNNRSESCKCGDVERREGTADCKTDQKSAIMMRTLSAAVISLCRNVLTVICRYLLIDISISILELTV